MKPYRVLATAITLILAARVYAASDTWDGGGADNNISTNNNWADNTAPVSDLANTDLIFAGTVRLAPNFSSTFGAHSVTFNSTAGAFTIGGQALSIGNGGIVNNDADTQIFNNGVLLQNPATFNATSGPLTFNGVVNVGVNALTLEGTGAFSFKNFTGLSSVTKNGAGTMTWSPTGAQESDFTINAGTVNTVADGSTDTFTNNSSIAVSGTSTLNFSENTTLDGAPLTRVSGATVTVATGKTLTIQNGSDATITGSFTNNNASIISVTGAGSTFTTTSTLTIHGGSSMNVNAAGSVSSGSSNLFIGSGTAGTVTVSDSGSSLGGGNLTIGSTSGTGSLTFSSSASGAFGSIQVDATAAAGTSGTLNVQSGATVTGTGLSLANGIGANTGTLTLTGTGSSLTLTTGLAIIGAASASTGNFNVQSGGTFNSSTASITVNATGTVAITGGTFNANGDMTLNGQMARDATGVFTLAAGKTLTIQNGGHASFTGSYDTANATYNITGSGSRLESLSGHLQVISGGQVNVSSGGLFAASDYIDVGTSGNGTLTVDGAGASATAANSSSHWGDAGGTASITFSNGATGTFNGASIAIGTTSGTTGILSVQTGASVSFGGGSISLAAQNSTGMSATININGTDSQVFQTGSSTLTVGNTSTSPAAINIGTTSNGGTLTTGTGLILINKTGTVMIGSALTAGTLNAIGNVTIDGGVLDLESGIFDLGTGKTMTIQNSGRFTNNQNYDTAQNAIYNISGTNSTLNSTGNVSIRHAAQVNVGAGGSMSAGDGVDVGTEGTDGTLSVIGSGSTATTASSSFWGESGGTATVAFSSGAIGTFGSLDLANHAAAGTTANVTVDSGATLTTGSVNMVASGGATTSAALIITGAGSGVSVSELTFGNTASGMATLTVTNGGSFVVRSGGSTSLRATGININGGTVDLQQLSNVGATINFTSGSLSYIGDLTVGTGGLLGNNLALLPGSVRNLTLTGTTTIDADHSLTLNAGSLSTGSLVSNGGFSFSGGTLSITGSGGLIIGSDGPTNSLNVFMGQTLNVTHATTITTGGLLTLFNGVFNTGSLILNSGTLTIQDTGRTIAAPIAGDASSTINIQATNIALGSAASFTGFNHQGVLNVGSNSVTLNSAGYARLGALTSLAAGTINAPNGVAFPSGSNFLGHGTISAQVAGESGSVIEADGALALGDAASPSGFTFGGQLRVKQDVVTLNSSSQAGLGNLTTLGGGVSPGTLNAPNGLVVDFADSITGFGAINSINTLAKRTIINGTAQGNSAAQQLTFTGYVKGVGSFNNVIFAGTFDPGLSPTLSTVGSIGFGPTSTLIMELGGTSPSMPTQYDAILASGTLTLNGALQVSLINGFAPVAGNSFDILDWGTLTGTFATLNLPALAAGLSWNTTQLYNNGILSVDAAGLAGDYNLDGKVDAADYVLWRKTPSAYGGDPAGYNTWRSNFGATGSGSGASTFADVPEPTMLTILSSVWTLLALIRLQRRLGLAAPILEGGRQ